MDQPTLPPDLTRLGWKIVTYPSGKMLATSMSWGCTGTKTNIEDVIKEARSMTQWCERQNQKRQALGR